MNLVPCATCRRHAQENASCPFCGSPAGAAPSPTRALRPLRLAAIALLAIGCDEVSPEPPYGAPPPDTNAATIEATVPFEDTSVTDADDTSVSDTPDAKL